MGSEKGDAKVARSIGSPRIYGSITGIRPTEIAPGMPLRLYVDYWAETDIYSPYWYTRLVVELDDGTTVEKDIPVLAAPGVKSVTVKDKEVSLGIPMPDRVVSGTVRLYGKGGLA